MSGKVSKWLITDTFTERKFVTNDAKSSVEILQKCPYLGKQEHVNHLIERKLPV